MSAHNENWRAAKLRVTERNSGTIVGVRRCRCEKFVQFPNNMANCCLEMENQNVWSHWVRVSPPSFPFSPWLSRRGILSHGALDARGEMMMMWCRRGEKTVGNFSKKRRRRDKQRQQLCVLLFGMQETSHAEHEQREDTSAELLRAPKASPLFLLLQSVNQSLLCRRRALAVSVPISWCSSCSALFNYRHRTLCVERDFPFLCKSSFHGILSLFICIMNAQPASRRNGDRTQKVISHTPRRDGAEWSRLDNHVSI